MAVDQRNKPRSRTEHKVSYHGRRMAFMVLAGIMVWGGITFWNQMEKTQGKAEELAALNEKLTEVTARYEATQREVARLNDDEYIEQKIRTELHYAKPGETVFYVSNR